MTVENTNNTISYTGNGSVTTFAYNFLTYSESHIFVYFDDVLQTVGYTVTDVGDDGGGDIVFNTAPNNGVIIRIDRTVPDTQLIEYQEYGPFPAKANERGLDLLTMAVQQNSRDLERAAEEIDKAKMDKKPEAPKGNIVVFDEDGNSLDSGLNADSIKGDKPPYRKVTKTLTDGQLVVDFVDLKVLSATISIGKRSGDGRVLEAIDDYDITGEYEITLKQSYEAGTICFAVTSEAVSSPEEFVKKFLTIDGPINDIGLEIGDALNLKEINYGDGQSSMWDVVLASSVTPNGDNIRQCVGNTSLAIVRRTYKEGAISEMYRRSLVHNLPFIDDAYNYIQSTYGHANIYPTAFAVDEVANELFVARVPNGPGLNSWGWVWVYDLTTAAFKTCFTFEEKIWEGLIVRRDGSNRYIYAADRVDSVYMGDITTLPSLYATVPVSIVANEAFTQLGYGGGNFYMTSRQFQQGQRRRTRFKIFDNNFNLQSETRLPEVVMGTFGAYLDLMAKSQSITFHKGRLFVGTGTIYKTDNTGASPDTISVYSGIQSVLPDGTDTMQALCRPDDAAVKLSEVTGGPVTLVENEGIYSTGENLYALWVTADSDDWYKPEFEDRGIAVTLELSDKPDRVDFSDVAAAIPKPINVERFSYECKHDSNVLKNPMTLTDLTSFQDIIDMMIELQMTSYLFYGDYQGIVDVNSDPTPSTGSLIEVTNIGSDKFLFKYTGASISREYWVDGSGTSQIIKNISFT